VASSELEYPVRVHYSYAFVRDGALAFRYDNAPHHRELATYPHHVHIGPLQRVSPADQPTLGQVLRQVESLLKT